MTFYDFLQKTCIWVLSLVPFAIVSLAYMPAFGPNVSVGSLIAIFHCMSVLAGCMYLAERWMAFWRVEAAADAVYAHMKAQGFAVSDVRRR